MSNYRQKEIPKVDENLFVNLKLGEIKKFVSDFFEKNIKNTKIENLHKGINVEIRKAGLRHILYARNAGYNKLKAVIIMKEMIRHATYCNFKEPDEDDEVNVLGYFNFKCKVNIENKIQFFRIAVRLTKDGKFYYDHAIKIGNKKNP